MEKHAEVAAESSGLMPVASTILKEIESAIERIAMTKAQERLVSVISGIVFILLLIVISLFVPNPTTWQYTLFRIVLAIAAAGFGSMIPGFLQANVSDNIKAGGALAIFVIIFFFSPAALVSNPP